MALFSFFSRGATLRALSALDDCQLSDLGLNRYDLADARRKGEAVSTLLAERRNERAGFWLR